MKLVSGQNDFWATYKSSFANTFHYLFGQKILETSAIQPFATIRSKQETLTEGKGSVQLTSILR